MLFKKANNIRRYRKINGFSQADLAILLDVKNASTISKWERGYLEPSISQLFLLSTLFNTTPQELYSLLWQEQQNAVAMLKARAMSRKKQLKSKEIFYL